MFQKDEPWSKTLSQVKMAFFQRVPVKMMALDYISLQVGFVRDFTIQIANFTVADVFASKNLFNCRINLIFDSTHSLWLGGVAQYPGHWSGSARQKK